MRACECRRDSESPARERKPPGVRQWRNATVCVNKRLPLQNEAFSCHAFNKLRQCHVINTPRAVCFVSKLAQASLGVQIEGSECFGVQDRRFPSSSDSESARGPLAERPPPHHESAPPPSPLSPLSLHPIELMVPMIPQDVAACNPPSRAG
jgi:hypothetical protein